VDEAVKQGEARRLRFVLGTEAGMITSIVRRVKQTLSGQVEVESCSRLRAAIAVTDDSSSAGRPRRHGRRRLLDRRWLRDARS
jgi:hypothetical protein